jgi:hypothetical protein
MRKILHLNHTLVLILTISFLSSSTGCKERKDKQQINQQIQRIENARKNSLRFLESIADQMDPVRLRQENGMKGKTFFVTYLNSYLLLSNAASDSEKIVYKNKISGLLNPLNTPEYHNLGVSPIKEFKQDIISYLNACRLLTKFGFDTDNYKKEIEKIHDRIMDPAHLAARGVDNTMALTYMLEINGFDGPYTNCEIYQRPACVMKSHPDISNIDLTDQMQTLKAYDITHEIFYLTNFGANPVECASPEDLEYAKNMVAVLLAKAMQQDNPDIAAELCVCLDYLGIRDHELYDVCIDYLLDGQNEDGSWGDYDWAEEYVRENRPDYIVEVGLYLHTVRVVLWALELAEEKLKM